MSTTSPPPGGWIDGLRLLQSRNAAIPNLLREALASAAGDAAIAASVGSGGVVTTGAGSSAAHARFLASVLAELGIAARFAPLTSFLKPPGAAAARQTLVVFSQGLSPNARLALRNVNGWHSVWLATATGADVAGAARPPGGDDDARRRSIDEAVAAGARLLTYPGANEYGTLLRLIGPMTGYAAALRFAASASGSAGPKLDVAVDDVCRAVAGAGEKLVRQAGDLPAHDLERNLVFVASGVHTERLENLRLKFLEGTLLPAPPVLDVLDFAHGPFQQLFAGRATVLALARAGAPGEDELLERMSAMLDPRRHRLVRLTAELPGPFAIFEHEALMNELVLRYAHQRKLDPRRWPGRDEDRTLYSYGAAASPGLPATGRGGDEAGLGAGRDGATAAPREVEERRSTASPAQAEEAEHRSRSLEELTWPELERFLDAGGRTAILPLGSIEQHGPHLPFATDAWIAGELARRLGSRLPESIELPVLHLGCASEHLGFPGTLSLRESTLASVLCDVAASVARHGFARLFVFSAHGGNRQALEHALPMMRAAADGLEVLAAPGLGAPMGLFHEASARHDVPPDASGHHAGEFETSIMLAVAPQSVRTESFAAGLAAGGRDLDGLFYPDLRTSAGSGTVGDPTGASGSRAEAYLDAWVESLLAIYRREENWK